MNCRQIITFLWMRISTSQDPDLKPNPNPLSELPKKEVFSVGIPVVFPLTLEYTALQIVKKWIFHANLIYLGLRSPHVYRRIPRTSRLQMTAASTHVPSILPPHGLETARATRHGRGQADPPRTTHHDVMVERALPSEQSREARARRDERHKRDPLRGRPATTRVNPDAHGQEALEHEQHADPVERLGFRNAAKHARRRRR